MRNLLAAWVVLWPVACLLPAQDTTFALSNGHWYDGDGFVAGTRYVVGGEFRSEVPGRIDVEIDLRGRYVVPPYAEAHNHWLEGEPEAVDAYVQHYLWRGVFYVKDHSTAPIVRREIAPHVNRPDSVDYVSANQGFTGPGGHPLQIVAQMQAVGAFPRDWGIREIDGGAVFVIDDLADLEASWPSFLADEPDFVKVFLLYSEVHEQRRGEPAYTYRRGIDPALVRPIVERAKAAGLSVSAHIYSAGDFRNAIVAGVDQIAHFPGIGYEEELGDEHFEIRDEDARLAAERGVAVITTLASALQSRSGADRESYLERIIRPNLARLRAAGVTILIGSDVMRQTTDFETRWLQELGLIVNADLLRMWCHDTPRAIFPDRKIGRLVDGYEASFLVLDGNPLEEWAHTQNISLRFKQGRMLMPRDPAFPPLGR